MLLYISCKKNEDPTFWRCPQHSMTSRISRNLFSETENSHCGALGTEGLINKYNISPSSKITIKKLPRYTFYERVVKWHTNQKPTLECVYYERLNNCSKRKQNLLLILLVKNDFSLFVIKSAICAQMRDWHKNHI